MEAAIGIEPINKGFAVRPWRLSLSVMECRRIVFIELFEEPLLLAILKSFPAPTKVAHSFSRCSYAAFDVGTRLMRSYSARRA